MKKMLAVTLAAAMAMCLTACGGSRTQQTEASGTMRETEKAVDGGDDSAEGETVRKLE